jgi:hypothetical protein
MKPNATLVNDQNVLLPSFQLSLWSGGKNIQGPERLNEIGLRYTLIVEHDFCEDDVNLICEQAERQGRCRVRFYGEDKMYVIERVMAS